MIHRDSESNRGLFQRQVNATRLIVAAIGILFAFSGMDHGFFETLQGNTPTPGLFISAIGPHNQMWTYGNELAFTLVPNFLLSGIAAISVSLLIAVWSIGYLHKKHASSIFLLLFIVLFLVGGGIAQVVYFTLAWAVSTRINKPLTWLKSVIPERTRGMLGRPWPWLLGGFVLLSLFALEIAIFGYVPGVGAAQQLLHTCWSLLGVGLVFLLLSIASGFVHDVDSGPLAER
ncbi:MAG TPA: hypothetical protein VKG86_12625 [Terracidiphilus sp.]|nr:hypothetical protein [Terracidiphilus sp.]